MKEEDKEVDTEKIFDFLHQIENLKNTLRWNKTSNGRQESTAEHSWRLAIMALVVSKELNLKIDINHAIQIALAHDIAEAITGDIDYSNIANGKILKTQKEKLELDAMQKLKKSLPENIGVEIIGLWKEYEECKTEEAKFIKALDKLETTTQQVEMGFKHYDQHNLIATYPNKAMQYYPALKPVWKIVKKELKEEFKKGNIPWKEEYDKI